MSKPNPRLVAWSLGHDQPLNPATREREWISQTPEKFAAHCLPLLIAAEAGYWITTPERVTVTWDGGIYRPSLHVEGPALSHFGSGIVTFTIHYLFRTAPGVQLLAKGPANWPKDGVAPLEGIIETEWTVATFTMNWKLTRPGTVVWEAGEPICELMPVRLSDFKSPMRVKPIGANPELSREHAAWVASRQHNNTHTPTNRQLDYRRGQTPPPSTVKAPPGAHFTRIRARVTHG